MKQTAQLVILLVSQCHQLLKNQFPSLSSPPLLSPLTLHPDLVDTPPVGDVGGLDGKKYQHIQTCPEQTGTTPSSTFGCPAATIIIVITKVPTLSECRLLTSQVTMKEERQIEEEKVDGERGIWYQIFTYNKIASRLQNQYN